MLLFASLRYNSNNIYCKIYHWKPSRDTIEYLCSGNIYILYIVDDRSGGSESPCYSVSPFLPATLLKSFMLVVEMGVPITAR